VIRKVPKKQENSHFHGSRVPPRNDNLYEIPLNRHPGNLPAGVQGFKKTGFHPGPDPGMLE
jgi:hypothetical protein